MRVGEQLRLAENAKQTVSAPRPSSAPFGGTFPEGKARGAFRSAVRANTTAANQREGQAPPLHYDEERTFCYNKTPSGFCRRACFISLLSTAPGRPDPRG